MIRTIQEAHNLFDLLVDKVATLRWKNFQRDEFLNLSQDTILQDRYDNFKIKKDYSFQAFQRIRDELRTLVVGSTTLSVITGNIFAYPEDYRHSLLLRTTIDGFVKPAPPTTYDALETIDDDPFEIPEPEFPRSIESQTGIEILFGTTGTITNVELFYIRNPLKISLANNQTSEFPGHLHDEWVAFAASKADGTAENYNKYKLLKQEGLEA